MSDIKEVLMGKGCTINPEKNEAVCSIENLDSILSQEGVENSISSVRLLKTTGQAKLRLRN